MEEKRAWIHQWIETFVLWTNRISVTARLGNLFGYFDARVDVSFTFLCSRRVSHVISFSFSLSTLSSLSVSLTSERNNASPAHVNYLLKQLCISGIGGTCDFSTSHRFYDSAPYRYTGYSLSPVPDSEILGTIREVDVPDVRNPLVSRCILMWKGDILICQVIKKTFFMNFFLGQNRLTLNLACSFDLILGIYLYLLSKTRRPFVLTRLLD